jgi:hypothetical protein
VPRKINGQWMWGENRVTMIRIPKDEKFNELAQNATRDTKKGRD